MKNLKKDYNIDWRDMDILFVAYIIYRSAKIWIAIR